MSKQFKSVPQCIYGSPCKMVCVNPQCRKPGFVCANGLEKKQECALFHQNCQKMQWSELENIIYQNPHTKIPQFSRLQDQMQIFFFDLLKKIKEEHVKFKIWSRAYGYSQQMMNFIHLVNEGHYNQISGVYMNQILSQIFMKQQKKFEAPFFIEDIQKIRLEMNKLFEKLSDLYNNTKTLTQSVSKRKIAQIPLVTLDSKITQEVEYIKSLFTKNNVKKFNLLYRASQNNFLAQQFHKKCDNIPNTLLLVHTQYGKIIGGYTPLAWNSTKKHWAPDKSLTSFLFSLDLKQRFALNLAQFAVACNPQKGPIYGCCDICIVDKSDQQKSNSQFPISYNNFKYNRSPQTSMAFSGSSRGKFLTKEWEVFHVQLEE